VAYVAAFNKHEAKTLAKFWSPGAVYTNRVTGEQVSGRDAIEASFAQLFETTKALKLDVSVESIQFISPNVAVEHGTSRFLVPDQEPAASRYSAVYVKRDGNWLLDRVSEEDVPVVISNYENLKELEWMIGTWVDQDEQSRIETTCAWTKNRNFITRMFSASVRDRVEMAGMQIVGWDPAAKQIRSWVFDSDGGFGEGVWSKHGNAWHVRSTGVAPDGSKSSSTNTIRFVDENTFTWQSIHRVAGGELLPNVDEVVVVRRTAVE
jgi:uncharacterized protein (TIGR02246 family)